MYQRGAYVYRLRLTALATPGAWLAYARSTQVQYVLVYLARKKQQCVCVHVCVFVHVSVFTCASCMCIFDMFVHCWQTSVYVRFVWLLW